MKYRHSFYIAVAFIFPLFSSLLADENKVLTPQEKFIFQSMIKLDQGVFDKADLKKAEEYYKSDKLWRQNFAAIIGQYHRVMKSDPVESIKTVGEFLSDRTEFKKWASAHEKGYKDALTQYKKDLRTAKKEKRDPPSEPTGLFAPLPKVSDWKIEVSTSDCALEAARSLMDLGAYREAVNILDRVGRDMQYLPRILAAETGGDLFVKTGSFQRAMEFYQFALKVLPTMKDEYTGRMADDIKYIGKRIRDSLNKARTLYEAEMYGPGYAAYRDAESFRLGDSKNKIKQNLLEAIIRYKEIEKEHAGTVWAEASACYHIKSLLQLAEDSCADEAGKYKESLEDEIKDLNKKLKLAKRAKAKKQVLKNIEKNIDEKEAHLAECEGVPLKEDACKTAEKIAKDFIKRNRFGLYRGEVMLDIANYRLEVLLDPDKAKPCYEQASEWFDKVREIDADLEAFNVPGTAATVAAPPPSERYKDSWSNITLSKIEPGKLFNRLESDWYLSSLHKDVILRKGLIFYTDKDYEKAKEVWEKLYKMDEYFKSQKQAGWGTVCSRLMRAVDKTPGSMYLEPDQMKHIKDKKKRLAVYLADINYFNELPLVSRKYYQNLLDEKYGRLSREERAIAIFGVFAGNCWDTSVDEVEFVKPYLSDLRGTEVEARILLGMGNRAAINSESDDFIKALKYYELLRKNCPNSPEALTALYTIGRVYRFWSQSDKSKKAEAIKYLTKYIKKKKDKGYVKSAKEYLTELEN